MSDLRELLKEAAEVIGDLTPPFNPAAPPRSERVRCDLEAALPFLGDGLTEEECEGVVGFFNAWGGDLSGSAPMARAYRKLSARLSRGGSGDKSG